MKKILFIFLSVLIAISAVSVYAETDNKTSSSNGNIGALTEMINKLMAQFQELKQKVEKIGNSFGSQATTTDREKSDDSSKAYRSPSFVGGEIIIEELPGSPKVSCQMPVMKQGTSSKSVYLLQMILKSQGYYPEGFITGYYGNLTKKAVQNYQKANNLLPNSGQVDDQTASLLNQLIVKTYPNNCSVIVPPTIGAIKVYSPSASENWYVGNTYTIRWNSGLSPDVKVSITLGRPRLACLDANPPCMTTQALVADVAPYTIVSSTQNDGSYEWTVPELLSAYIGNDQITVQTTDGATIGRSSGFFIKKQSTSDNKSPVVSGVTGPSVLKIGETGVWTIKASDPENGSLNYSVIWGDEKPTATNENKQTFSSSYVQQATFTHAYSESGIYYPTFIVTDDHGQNAKTSVSVKVDSNISATSTPIIVSSPQSQAQWILGETHLITWSGGTYTSGDTTTIPAYVTITMAPPRPACLDATPACSIAEVMPYTIAQNASNNGSYSWTLPTSLMSTYTGTQQITVTAGSVVGRSQTFSIIIPPTTTQAY